MGVAPGPMWETLRGWYAVNKQREAEENENKSIAEGLRATLRNLYATEVCAKRAGDEELSSVLDEVIRLLLPQSEHYNDLAYRGLVEESREPVQPLGEQHGR